MQPEEEQPDVERRHPETDASSSYGLFERLVPVLRRVVFRASIGVVVLGIVLWIAGSMGAGMRFIVPFALDRAAPAGWSVDVGAVSGNWFNRVDIEGLSLSGPSIDVDVETVELRHRLRPLLRRTVDIRGLSLTRPTVALSRPTDSVAAADDTASNALLRRVLAGEPVGGWAVRVGEARVEDAHVDVDLGGGQRYSLASLNAAAAGSMGESGVTASVDTLRTDFVSVVPVRADSAFRSTGRLTASARLENGELNVDTLLLESEGSSLGAGGRLTFTTEPALLSDATFALRASPLDLRDLPLVLPQPLAEDPRVDLTAMLSGRPDSILAEVDGRALAGSTWLQFEGVLRPGDGGPPARPALEGTAAWEGVDLSIWTSQPSAGSVSGEGTFTLDAFTPGAAFTFDASARHEPKAPDDARLVARPLRLDAEASGRLPTPVDSGASRSVVAEALLSVRDESGRYAARLSAAADGTSARWSVDATLDSGRVEGTGRARWQDVPGVTVERLSAHALDLSVIDTIYPATMLSGVAAGRIDGRSLDSARGTLRVDLATSSVREVALDTLAIDAEVRGPSAAGTVLARSATGDVEGRYRLELSDSTVRVESPQLRLARPASADPSSPAVVAFGTADGTWQLGAQRSGSLEARVDSAYVGEISVREADVAATLVGQRIAGSLQASVGGVLPTVTTVRVSLEADALTVAEANGQARVHLVRPHAADSTRLDSASVELEARSGDVEFHGWARPASGGLVRLDGKAALAPEELRFEVDARGGLPEPVNVLGGTRVDSLDARVVGRRIGSQWEDVRGDLTLRDVRWRDIVAPQVVSAASFDSTGLRLDTLTVDSNVFTAHGGGALPSGGEDGVIEVRVDIVDLEPIREMVGRRVLAAGRGSLDLRGSGTLDSIMWTASGDMEAVVVDEVRLTGIRLDADGRSVGPRDVALGLASTQVRLMLDRVILPTAELGSVELIAAGGPDSVQVAVDAIADDRRDASFRVTVDPHPDRRNARVEDVRFRIDEDEWRLVEQAMLSYGDGVMVEPLLLRAGEQEIRIEGGVTADRVLDLNARMDSTDVGTVADLIGLPRLRGWLSGRLRLQGDVEAPEAWLDLNGAFHHVGRPPGPVQARVRANGRRIRGDVLLRDARAGTLTLSGGGLLPEPGRRARSTPEQPWPDGTIAGFPSDSVDVSLEAARFDLRWLEAFFSAETLASLGGTLDGALTLQGSTDDPELGGNLALRDGSAQPTALGVRWDSLAVVVRGDGARLAVDSASVRSGPGRLTASGTMGIEGAMPVDIGVGLRDFQAIRTDAYSAVVSGSVDVAGVARAPTLEGDIRVESVDVYLDERVTSEGLEPVELTDEDLRMLRERFGVVPELGPPRRDFSERITADFEVFFGRDSWLRKRTSPEMAVPFTGSIQVALRPGEVPSMQGSVDVIERRGFVEQFGRRFELTEGTVTFDGPPEATEVDLRATYTIPSRDNPDDNEVVIVLEVSGTQSNLGLTLSSEPQLENADIVSYIATGRPASGSLSLEGASPEGGLVAAGADYALSQMTAAIEAAAARSVGLDVIEIRREGLREATLVAGKYLSPRLYVGFARPILQQDSESLSYGAQQQSELEIEYEALRWLIVNIEGSGSSVRFFLRARRAY